MLDFKTLKWINSNGKEFETLLPNDKIHVISAKLTDLGVEHRIIEKAYPTHNIE